MISGFQPECYLWCLIASAQNHTFGSIHAPYSIKCTHSGLSRFGPWTLKHGPSLRQEVVLHGFHQQLLAFQVIRKHLVVFQICKELNYKELHYNTQKMGKKILFCVKITSGMDDQIILPKFPLSVTFSDKKISEQR